MSEGGQAKEYATGELVDVETLIGTLRGSVVQRTELDHGLGFRYSVRLDRSAHPWARGVLCAVDAEAMKRPEEG